MAKNKMFLLAGVLFFWSVAVCAADIGSNVIGIVIAANGKAYAENTNGEKRFLQRRSDIYLHDQITTQDNSNIQLKLKDDTVLSIKPNTKYSIQEFKLDKNDPKNSAYVGKLVTGALLSVSGGIQQHSLKTPVTTLAIRGTLFESGFATKKSEKHALGFGWVSVPEGKLNITNGEKSFDISSSDPKMNSCFYKAFGSLDGNKEFGHDATVAAIMQVMSEAAMHTLVDKYEAFSGKDFDTVAAASVADNTEDMTEEEDDDDMEEDVDVEESDDDDIEDVIDEITDDVEETEEEVPYDEDED